MWKVLNTRDTAILCQKWSDLPHPSRLLSASISPAKIKEADDAVSASATSRACAKSPIASTRNQ